ncbi:MAG: molecular chaperone [Acidobacteriota bacterium]
MNTRRILIVLLLLVATVPLAAQPPKLGVSPPKFELHLDDAPGTQAFRVFNYDDEPFDAEITVHNWDLDEHSKTRILPPTEQSLDQWIVINPVRFTIEPNSSQVVRFSVRPQVEPEPGEHRAVIYVTSQPSQEKSLSMRFTLKLGMAVYGYVGDVQRAGTLHDVRVDGPTALFDLSSTGTAHVRLDGQYAVWLADRYPGGGEIRPLAEPGSAELPPGMLQAGALPAKPVLAGTRRQMPLQFAEALAPGEYVLDVKGRLGETAIDRAVPFVVGAAGVEVAAE